MQLSKDSSARKISRNEVEVKLNAAHKTYVLIQVNLANAPPKDEHFIVFDYSFFDKLKVHAHH